MARGVVAGGVVVGLGAALLTSLIAVAAPGPRPAAVVDSAAKKASAAAKKGAWPEVVAHLEDALHAARKEAPLDVRNVVVTSTPHGGLGVYEPADGGRVVGRDVKLYVEVANAGHRPTVEGTFEVFLEVSASFRYEDGTELGERALGTHRYQTRTEAGVVSFGLDVGLSEKAPAGRYDLVIKVTDLGRDQSAIRPVFFVLPEIAERPVETSPRLR